jgi:DNA adenine methylase
VKTSSPLKWHGGKTYLAAKLVALMPPHTHYVEPYFGGGSVLFAKDPEGVSEVVNDIDKRLSNFWDVLRDEDRFKELVRECQAAPFSEVEWKKAADYFRYQAGFGQPAGCVEHFPEYCAYAFFVLCRQSMAGRMRDFATLSRNRTRRGMNEQASAWLAAVEGLPAVHARLKRVVILNREALDVIRQQDGPNTLFYLDPPYLKETRTSPDVYAHEMTDAQHLDLHRVCTEMKGKFLLSGYRSKLYDDTARNFGWHRTDFELPNNASGGAEKRRMVESVWTNFNPAAKEAA